MNKRIIFKHKICRRYEEDIWGIFFRKQQRRDFVLKNINYMLFMKKTALWYNFYKDRRNINIVKQNMLFIRNLLFSRYLNLSKKKKRDKFTFKNSHYLRTEYFLSFFFGIRIRQWFYFNKIRKAASVNSIIFQKYKKKNYITQKRRGRIYTIQEKLLKNKKLDTSNFTLDLIPKTNITRKNKMYKSLYYQRISKIWTFRKFYGCLTNSQLKRICLMSYRKRGDIVANFLILLESRIDTVLYRAGFVSSIFEARQIISHKKILVNEQVVNVRSALLKSTDILSIHPKYFKVLKWNLINRIHNKTIMFYNINYYETSYRILHILFIPKLLKVNEVPYNFEISDKDINSILYYYY